METQYNSWGLILINPSKPEVETKIKPNKMAEPKNDCTEMEHANKVNNEGKK